MNFVQFAIMYVVNNELTKLPDNVIPRIFATYSSNVNTNFSGINLGEEPKTQPRKPGFHTTLRRGKTLVTTGHVTSHFPPKSGGNKMST